MDDDNIHTNVMERAEYQKKTFALAQEGSQMALSLYSDVSILLDHLRPKSKQHTGLPVLIRKLDEMQKQLPRFEPDLRKSDESSKMSRRQVNDQCNFIKGVYQKWSILQRCQYFVAINQTFQGLAEEAHNHEIPMGKSKGDKKDHLRILSQKGKVEVDVVDSGAEWLYIRSLNKKRLGIEMTVAGWEWQHEIGEEVDRNEWEECPLAQQVKKLVSAARMNRFEYRFPRIRVVLPSLRRGDNVDIDLFLDQLTKIDPNEHPVEVIISDSSSTFLTTPPPSFNKAISKLVGDKHRLGRLTTMLNLEHSILISLVSDITHARLKPQPWQNSQALDSIKDENSHKNGIMAKILHRVLRDRKLVCTKETAERFLEVVNTVGSETERTRANILIQPTTPIPDARLYFSEMTIHHRLDIQVPLTVLHDSIDYTKAVVEERLPEVALDVARFSRFNKSQLSTYMYGWMEGIVTVTSNKAVNSQIINLIEGNRKKVDEMGPRIYAVDCSRTLLAKYAVKPQGWDEKDGLSSGRNGSKGYEDKYSSRFDSYKKKALEEMVKEEWNKEDDSDGAGSNDSWSTNASPPRYLKRRTSHTALHIASLLDLNE